MDPRTWNDVDTHLAERALDHDPVLESVERACRDADLPAIAISPLQGAFLALLVRSTGARRVLEVGTLGGVSAIWMVRALPADGRLVTLEVDPHHAQVAQANFERAGIADRVELLIDDAHASLATLRARDAEPFDFVFVDADKRSYPDYLQACIGLCRPGALIVADNVVRRGRILDATDDDPDVVGMRTFLDRCGEDPRVDVTFLQTVGTKGWDGFAFVRVKD